MRLFRKAKLLTDFLGNPNVCNPERAQCEETTLGDATEALAKLKRDSDADLKQMQDAHADCVILNDLFWGAINAIDLYAPDRIKTAQQITAIELICQNLESRCADVISYKIDGPHDKEMTILYSWQCVCGSDALWQEGWNYSHTNMHKQGGLRGMIQGFHRAASEAFHAKFPMGVATLDLAVIKEQTPRRPNLEYHQMISTIGHLDLETHINNFGKSGWEMCGIVAKGKDDVMIFFKREKLESESQDESADI